jgi:hypothetical protein
MDICLTLAHLVPMAEYSGSLTANTRASFDALLWRDARTKPTWAELNAAAADALAAYEAARPVGLVEELAEMLFSKGQLARADADKFKARG